MMLECRYVVHRNNSLWTLSIVSLFPFLVSGGEGEGQGQGFLHTHVTSYSQIQLTLRKGFNAPRVKGK